MNEHALAFEGAPHDDDGNRITEGFKYHGVGGPGRAKCRCGAMSELLYSGYMRKRWYREHRTSTQVKMHLAYYNTDDGIYLVCDHCEYEQNLGHWPTPEQVATAAQEHRHG